MQNPHLPPRSPFTTRLSGSARETEQRIRSIVQWKKRRPPVLLLLPALLLIVLCGGLVSCQNRGAAVSLVMDVQHYDALGNYIEIPALAVSAEAQPPQGVTDINQALAQLKQEYQPVLEGSLDSSSLSSRENHCLLYPTQTQRYWNPGPLPGGLSHRPEHRTRHLLCPGPGDRAAGHPG